MESLPQESLGTGLKKQISKFSNMQSTVSDLYYELEELIKRCESVKKECAERTQSRLHLQKEIDKLQAERDCLIQEVRDAANHTTHTTSSTSSSSSSMGFDQAGKMNRKVWLLEQDLKDAHKQIELEKEKAEGSIMEEIAVSEGLRGKIGELESALQSSELKVKQEQQERLRMNREWEVEMANKASQRAGLTSELQDIRDALSRERAERARLESEAERLKREKVEMEAEIRTIGKQDRLKSPGRVLQPHQPNIVSDSAKAPTTPSKTRYLEAGSTFPSSPILSPTTSLTRRFAHLEERHKLLKGEYDKLRAKYSEDLKHWKEYKAVETARINLKKQRKAEKRDARSKSASIPAMIVPAFDEAGPLPPAYELVEASDNSQSMTPEIPKGRSSQKGRKEASSSATAGRSEVEKRHDSPVRVTRSQARSSQQRREQSPKVIQKARGETPKQAQERSRRGSTTDREFENDMSTPVSSTSRRMPSAARVTPWLGTGHAQSTSSTKQGKRGDDDIFDDHPSPSISSTAHRTPLVRDRGPNNSSLRRTILRKPVDGYIADDPTTPLSETSTTKRKHADMEHLSPAQKAAELKKLSKMSTKEKREYYAEYKGKGRYLAPEEVKTRVYDEYEIDPAQNEGEKYQFHDVKRQKAERKLMHGGDCECCKEYYDAIGPIPKYNQGPQWKDPSQTDRSDGEVVREAELKEHQNKVSRHRETWRRAPTPPGFWNIGFPTTQAVAEQNAQADEMVAKREAEVRREAAHRDSKWKKKN